MSNNKHKDLILNKVQLQSELRIKVLKKNITVRQKLFEQEII